MRIQSINQSINQGSCMFDLGVCHCRRLCQVVRVAVSWRPSLRSFLFGTSSDPSNYYRRRSKERIRKGKKKSEHRLHQSSTRVITFFGRLGTNQVRIRCFVVVSHIQRIVGCQPEKTTSRGGQSRSWSAEQGKKKEKGKVWQRHIEPCFRSFMAPRQYSENN